ncbi:Cysteine--tRNA ligase [Buchnera aphidicola (Phyllaphis fagi)]|uniref:cysteine--tRNA ligase n=1 Tax=Buchnera aphidicola TaxID=9 RepID=UPI00346406EA
MLKIFNTITKKKEFFFSNNFKKINMYVCGVTVYDYCHIGHGRTFTFFDMIVKYLQHCRYKFNYVRNITDIDDKIIQKSKMNKEKFSSLTKRMILEMKTDFKKLGLQSPTFQPLATHHINTIINMIQVLLDNKNAYIAINGDIIFSVSSYLKYGVFSSQLLNKLQNNNKKNILNIKYNNQDFVLWKKQVFLDDPCWESPWGKGRPGWHIECSAINHDYFSSNFDIHGGGIDLLFPHHENERAQSICFNSIYQYGNYWMHVGMLLIRNKKMSKSLDNSLSLKNILKTYDSEVIRYFFLSTHYRSPLYYSQKNIQKSCIDLRKLYFILYKSSIKDLMITDKISHKYYYLSVYFYKSMNDDFNTPQAISILFKLAQKISFYLNNYHIVLAKQLAYQLKYLANTIGLLSQDPIIFLNKYNSLNKFNDINQNNYIIEIIKKRNIARKYNLWGKADKLRNKLYKLNIILEDTPCGTLWKKGNF